MRSERDKMLSGELYSAACPELMRDRRRAKMLCARYNARVEELDLECLRELFGRETQHVHLEPPFFCDYGYNLSLGARVYANHNLVVLDCAKVEIGDDVAVGPNVVISTAGHPVDAVHRTAGLEFARPIHVGHRVWIGASVTLLPGVTIGDDTTIGAGSVVTRSIPANCVAFGNPCRVVRQL